MRCCKLNIVRAFCSDYGFETEAIDYLSNAYLSLVDNEEAYKIFSGCVAVYENNTEFEHEPVFSQIEDLSKTTGINKYTLDLLYLIALTPHLKKLYEQNDISLDIYDSSVCDLKWKAKECKAVYGVWGTFVGWWTIGFFKLRRFGIGRLQFNLKKFSKAMNSGVLSFNEGDIYIDVHIPSSGALNYDECQESYKLAAEFFKDYFKGKPIVFGCHSWLLSPDNYQILPADSNVLKFMKDYTILEEEKDPTNNNLWRIFNRFDLPQNLQDLPQNSSLQRAFVKWLSSGNTINVAFGVIIKQ